MFLVSILAATYVIGIVQSTPTSTYQRRDLQLADPPEFLLYNQIPGVSDGDLLEQGTDRNAGGTRIKRLGSLSIVNPLDVLRDRVMLELARRKMRQNQRQVDANRRFLQTIGKRAISNTAQLGMDSNEASDPTSYASSKVNDFLYAYRVPDNDIEVEGRRDQHQQFSSDRGTERRQVWGSNAEDPAVQETENDQTRREDEVAPRSLISRNLQFRRQMMNLKTKSYSIVGEGGARRPCGAKRTTKQNMANYHFCVNMANELNML